jgi:2-polyprenyl-6-methoxyphenol hydroxylase-like FAD-dependent oxidoreductase
VHAVVLGGGLAGETAAAALARRPERIERVTLIERDALPVIDERLRRCPEEVTPRASVPQAAHAHLLMSTGARAIETLLPGTVDRLHALGAHHIPLPEGLIALTSKAWVDRDLPESQHIVTCSRPLLDSVITEQLRRQARIQILENTKVLELLGDARRVTGVRVTDQATGQTREINADLVVDARGRSSTTKAWLRQLGIEVERDCVDPRLVYATRIYRAPAGAHRFPAINIQSRPGTDIGHAVSPGSGAVVPIEGGEDGQGRWMVTLGGRQANEPPKDPEGWLRYAREGLRDPLIADLLSHSDAQALTPVRTWRTPPNQRLYYEDARMPEGLLVIGSSLAEFNPLYAHGMTVAAQCAVRLYAALGRASVAFDARQVQQDLARETRWAWEIATSEDKSYPETRLRELRRPPSRGGWKSSIRRNYLRRAAATRRPAVTRAIYDTFTLAHPARLVLDPWVAFNVLLGPRRQRPPLSTPPLTPAETHYLPTHYRH